MKVYRSDKSKGNTSGFTLVDNGYIHNPNLSTKAKGLFTFLLSLHEDINPSIKFIQSMMSDKYSSIRSSLNELILNGYLDEVEVSNDQKHLRYYDYTLYEKGKDEVYRKSIQGIQKTDTGYTENPNLIKTNNKDIYIKGVQDLNLVEIDLLNNKIDILSLFNNQHINFNPKEYEKRVSIFIDEIKITSKYMDKTINELRSYFINYTKSNYKKKPKTSSGYEPKYPKPTEPKYKILG